MTDALGKQVLSRQLATKSAETELKAAAHPTGGARQSTDTDTSPRKRSQRRTPHVAGAGVGSIFVDRRWRRLDLGRVVVGSLHRGKRRRRSQSRLSWWCRRTLEDRLDRLLNGHRVHADSNDDGRRVDHLVTCHSGNRASPRSGWAVILEVGNDPALDVSDFDPDANVGRRSADQDFDVTGDVRCGRAIGAKRHVDWN